MKIEWVAWFCVLLVLAHFPRYLALLIALNRQLIVTCVSPQNNTGKREQTWSDQSQTQQIVLFIRFRRLECVSLLMSSEYLHKALLTAMQTLQP